MSAEDFKKYVDWIIMKHFKSIPEDDGETLARLSYALGELEGLKKSLGMSPKE